MKRHKFNFDTRKDALKCVKVLDLLFDKHTLDTPLGYGIIDDEQPKQVFIEFEEEE